MGILIVEKHMGTKSLQHLGFWYSAKEKGLIHADIPVPQGMHHPGMRRAIACCDYGKDTFEEPQLRACLRGRSYRARLYSPERLLYPMVRVGKRGERAGPGSTHTLANAPQQTGQMAQCEGSVPIAGS